MKRGIMYRLCREQGYGVLALAQHLDDLAESLLLSLFHGGQLRTMKAHYLNDAGDVRIIRPLAHCRERQTADFALAAGLPVIPDSCPACFAAPTRREHMKALLAREEAVHPHLFTNILHAMRPLLTEGLAAPSYRRGAGLAEVGNRRMHTPCLLDPSSANSHLPIPHLAAN
jgi:tRNA(Ile)-lysidine synthase TilS/MesJ